MPLSISSLPVRKLFAWCALPPLLLVASHAHAFEKLALGGNNICAVDSAGTLDCRSYSPRPYVLPDDGTLYTDVVSGGSHSCAITQAGTLRCWGLNAFGQNNNVPESAVPFISLTAGENHTCALDADGRAYCWGLNANGQIDVPVSSGPYASLHAGAQGTCGILTSGATECWSNDSSYNQAFIDTDNWVDFVFPSEQFVSGPPACGLNTNGDIRCWISSPALPAPDNGPYVQIEGDRDLLCGRHLDGSLDCSLRVVQQAFVNEDNLDTLADIGALPPLVDFKVLSNSARRISLCGLDVDGNLLCAGLSVPADSLPGEALIPAVPFDLRFSVYSDTAGELFWRADTSSIGRNSVQGYNVYRNGELVTSGPASSSYVDEDLQPGETYTYEVSIVQFDDNEGARSDALTVTTPGGGGAPGNSNNSPDYPLEGMSLDRYGATSLELFWDRPVSFGVTGRYDIFRNGQYLTSTPGPSFYDDDLEACEHYEYTIAAVSRSGQIVALGFQSEGAFANASCP